MRHRTNGLASSGSDGSSRHAWIDAMQTHTNTQCRGLFNRRVSTGNLHPFRHTHTHTHTHIINWTNELSSSQITFKFRTGKYVKTGRRTKEKVNLARVNPACQIGTVGERNIDQIFMRDFIQTFYVNVSMI